MDPYKPTPVDVPPACQRNDEQLTRLLLEVKRLLEDHESRITALEP